MTGTYGWPLMMVGLQPPTGSDRPSAGSGRPSLHLGIMFQRLGDVLGLALEGGRVVEYVWMWGVIAGVLAVVSAVLLSGRGAGLLAGYSTASPSERAHVNTMRLCRIMSAGTLVCAAYAIAVALLVYAHVLGALDRTALFLVAGIGAIAPVVALCIAGYRANMGTYV